MRNPLRFLSPEARRTDAAAEALYQQIRQAHAKNGHNAAIDLKRDEQTVKIVLRLLQIHPNVNAVLDSKTSIMLTLRSQMEAGVSEQLYKDLVQQKLVINRDSDDLDDALSD